MRGMIGLGPREENNFALINSAQILEVLNQLTAVFFLVMLGLSSTGLLVGGVGVVGIMLIEGDSVNHSASHFNMLIH